jgi:hypothetical protein
MGIESNLYGVRPLLRCRGTVGTSQVNLNPLAVNLRWASVFDVAYQLDLSSSSTADKGTPTAGTGARVVRVVGLDNDYNRHYEDVTLNGQTKVTTATKFRRVFGLYVKTAGTGLVNAGDIYVVKVGTGGTYTGGVPGTLTSAVLKALVGNNLAFSGLFTAPAGCQYSVQGIIATARAQAGTVILVRGNAGDAEFPGPFESLKIEVSNDTAVNELDGISLLPKEDMYIQAVAAGAGGIINCTVNLVQTSGPAEVQV